VNVCFAAANACPALLCTALGYLEGFQETCNMAAGKLVLRVRMDVRVPLIGAPNTTANRHAKPALAGTSSDN
jgi:hypothetical protein